MDRWNFGQRWSGNVRLCACVSLTTELIIIYLHVWFRILSADLSAFKKPVTIALFSVSIVLLIAFPFQMRRREQAGQPALVPNSLWNNVAFTTTCIMVTLSYGVLSSMELFSSL